MYLFFSTLKYLSHLKNPLVINSMSYILNEISYKIDKIEGRWIPKEDESKSMTWRINLR